MSVNLSPLGGAGAQFFTNDGVPLTGGLLYTYQAGTTTPATTYTSSNGLTALANPIILDAAGRVPTGEIWLTDGISYKFVLKDSTDVLIATWDGLSGINSNFIAYTSLEETATATAGQTVFNLTLDYIVNSNNLAVYVNGSNQIVNVNYLETDTNTVTFLTGLNVGDVVKFSTATPVSTNATDAANVSYTPGGIDAVSTNVQAKLRQYVSVQDFGAVGDGVADDTDAIQNALDASDYVYLPPGTYLVSSPLTITTGSGKSICGSNRGKTVITKVDLSAPNVTRTYDSVVFNYNVPCIFALIAADESYVRYVNLENINLVGLAGDETQVAIFAPRVTYSIFQSIEARYGKSMYESTALSFVNTFISVRSREMAGGHFIIENGLAYSFYNVYANVNVSSGDASLGFSITSTNASFFGCTADGFNIGWQTLGTAQVSLHGCTTEARIRHVDAQDSSTVDVIGGRYMLTIVQSQAASEATCFKTSDTARIVAKAPNCFMYDSTTGYSNKYLAISSDQSNVILDDVDLRIVGGTSVAFTLADLIIAQNGIINYVEKGDIVKSISGAQAIAGIEFFNHATLSKQVNFASALTGTIATFTALTYNTVLIADVDVIYRATGSSGARGVSGSAKMKLTASSRTTDTIQTQQLVSSLCPDGATETITLSAAIAAGVVTIIATASNANVGTCYFQVKPAFVASGTSTTTSTFTVS
jgi:hypothetical protein